VIAGVAKGRMLVAFDNRVTGGDRVFLEGTDAIPRCTAGPKAASNGRTVDVTVRCTSALRLNVTVRKGTTKLAKGMFSIAKPNTSQKLTVPLTAAGKSALKAHDHLTATLVLATNVFTTTSTLAITAP
jgi:hypothetical protein